MNGERRTISVPAWIVGSVAVALLVWIFGLFGVLAAPFVLVGIGLQARNRGLVVAGVVLGAFLILAAVMSMPVGGVEGGISDVATE